MRHLYVYVCQVGEYVNATPIIVLPLARVIKCPISHQMIEFHDGDAYAD